MPTLQWYHNEVLLQPRPNINITIDQQSGESFLEIIQVSKAETGLYQVVAKNSSGFSTSTCIITLKCEWLDY